MPLSQACLSAQVETMKPNALKISLVTILFGVLLLSIISNTIAQPPLYGQDMKDPGAWMIEKDVAPSIAADLPPLASTYNDQSMVFDISYINMGNVESLYLALKHWQFDTNSKNNTNSGVTPFQMLIQRYHTVGGEDVITINTFAGLVAYLANNTRSLGPPNRNDALYYGWMQYGAWEKHAINGVLQNSFGVPPADLMNEGIVPTATPIWSGNSSSAPNTVTFGMTYTNLFVLWYPVADTSEPNSTLPGVTTVGNAVAWSVISNVTFVFTMTSIDLGSGKTAVSTETTYKIGNITDLWVREASIPTASQFNATGGVGAYSSPFPSLRSIGNLTIAHYNTSQAIYDRLNGTATTPGFSLGIINYASILLLGKNDNNLDSAWDNGSGSSSALSDTSNQQVQDLTARVAKRAVAAFNIDFSTHATYAWNGSTALLASPTYVYPKVNVAVVRAPFDGAHYLIWKLWQSEIQGAYENSYATSYVGDLTYITCFPQWNGLACVQDPTFTAYTSLEGGIDFAPIGLIGLAAVPAIFLLIQRVRSQH